MEQQHQASESHSVAEEFELQWRRDTVPRVFTIVSSYLPQRDLVSLLLLSPTVYRTLTSYPSMWKVIDFHEMNNAGDRLLAALSLPRYRHVKEINLEFTQGVEDKHLELVRSKVRNVMIENIDKVDHQEQENHT